MIAFWTTMITFTVLFIFVLWVVYQSVVEEIEPKNLTPLWFKDTQYLWNNPIAQKKSCVHIYKTGKRGKPVLVYWRVVRHNEESNEELVRSVFQEIEQEKLNQQAAKDAVVVDCSPLVEWVAKD